MYNNIGKKIKSLAKAIFVIEAIGAVITGIILMATDDDLIGIGLLVMLVGSIVAWISSWFLYGFGQLIDNSDKLVKSLCNDNDIEDQSEIKRETAATKIIGNQSQTSQIEKETTLPTQFIATGTGTCQICWQKDVPICNAKIVDETGIRYRHICSDCYEKNNASPA